MISLGGEEEGKAIGILKKENKAEAQVLETKREMSQGERLAAAPNRVEMGYSKPTTRTGNQA